MSRPRRTVTTLIAGSGALALALTGCAPGSGASSSSSTSLNSVSKDISKSGKVTLTVWDQNTDGGISKAQDELNEAFMKKYPDVTIKRVSRSFSDLKTTLKLALSGDNPPDVVQANQGYPDMGAFVGGKLLRPVDDYSKLYGWDSYYPEQFLKLNKFSPDGKKWQQGSLYGVSQTGELVGTYYNKKILNKVGVKAPTTLADLEKDLAAAKAKGVLPLAYGDLDKYPGIHIFGVVQAATAGPKAVNALVTGAGGAWTDPSTVKAATTLQDWQKKKYLTPGANGVGIADAVKTFSNGGSAFHIDGTWELQPLAQSLGKDVGFAALTPEGGSGPATTGGEGLAWAITSKAKKPDVAAAYIDFVTNTAASKVLLKAGMLPTVVPKDYTVKKGTLQADVISAYRKISDGNGLVPYLDYTTPTFYDTLTAGVQQLTAGQQTPKKFTEALQKDYSAFQEKQK